MERSFFLLGVSYVTRFQYTHHYLLLTLFLWVGFVGKLAVFEASFSHPWLLLWNILGFECFHCFLGGNLPLPMGGCFYLYLLFIQRCSPHSYSAVNISPSFYFSLGLELLALPAFRTLAMDNNLDATLSSNLFCGVRVDWPNIGKNARY